jgi:hypothetical protein
MCAGADSIDDLDMLRAGGMPIVFDGVYAPSTLGTLCCGSSASATPASWSRVLREHLVALAARAEVLAGHAKQGASYGHTKIAGRQVLRKGLAVGHHDQHRTLRPGDRRHAAAAGKTGSGKGPGRMVAQAIATARAAAATGKILVRGDSAYGNHAVVRACRCGKAEFCLVMTKNPAITRAIAAIPDTAWTPVRYPGAVRDPDTGAWISDAEAAEVPYTAFAATTDRITARLVVRRVKDARYPDALFPVWRYHPFVHQLDPAHRRSRHRRPPTRDHRNHVRRPDRRPSGPSCFADFVDQVPAAAQAARTARVSCGVACSGRGPRNLAAMMTRRSLMVMSS